MGTPTYQPIAEITLGSSASSVTFSNITQAYRDLVLVINAKSTYSSTDYLGIRINGDTGSNYFHVYAGGNDNNQASSGTQTLSYLFGPDTPASSASHFALSTYNIMDYSATDKHKTALIRSGNLSTPLQVIMDAARWANTAAINSLVISLPYNSSSLSSGSTFALYGILA